MAWVSYDRMAFLGRGVKVRLLRGQAEGLYRVVTGPGLEASDEMRFTAHTLEEVGTGRTINIPLCHDLRGTIWEVAP